MNRILFSVIAAVVVAGSFAAFGPQIVAAAPAAEVASAQVTLHVDGMHCASCPITVRIALERLPGVTKAVVSQKRKQAVVTYDPTKVTLAQIAQAVTGAGYPATVPAAK